MKQIFVLVYLLGCVIQAQAQSPAQRILRCAHGTRDTETVAEIYRAQDRSLSLHVYFCSGQANSACASPGIFNESYPVTDISNAYFQFESTQAFLKQQEGGALVHVTGKLDYVFSLNECDAFGDTRTVFVQGFASWNSDGSLDEKSAEYAALMIAQKQCGGEARPLLDWQYKTRTACGVPVSIQASNEFICVGQKI